MDFIFVTVFNGPSLSRNQTLSQATLFYFFSVFTLTVPRKQVYFCSTKKEHNATMKLHGLSLPVGKPSVCN